TEQDSRVLSERTGSLDAGEDWSFQGELAPTEILAINNEPTLMYGVQTENKINRRLVNLSIEMRALKSHAKAAEELEKMLTTVTIDGQRVTAPTHRECAGTRGSFPAPTARLPRSDGAPGSFPTGSVSDSRLRTRMEE